MQARLEVTSGTKCLRGRFEEAGLFHQISSLRLLSKFEGFKWKSLSE